MRRILLILAVVVIGSLGVVTAASGGQFPTGGSSAAPSGPDEPDAEAPAQPVAVAYAPAVGTTGSSPTDPASVTVTDGTLTDVTLKNADGEAVEGEFNAERTSWSTTEPLGYDATYTWSGTASGADGAPVALAGEFTTLKPDKVVRGQINIGDDRTVGVAAPIRIQFNDHVEDKAAVEKALKVETSKPVEGSWGWLPDEGGGSRVDYRPKEYWPAYTDVTITADLYGVAYGNGRYGAADVTSSFEIGREQIVKADAKSYRMLVIRDGQQVADYPASYGLDSDPDRNTRSGIHVVSEKFTDKRMTSERYGYDLIEKWAVRISNNGEFVHANPASSAAQGSANVSHGCINLSTEDAKAYYDTALYGDPVEVTGTGVELSQRDGDIADWTYSWEQWKSMSAL
ncbi:L,D-transpeptidase [Pseudonocardia lacus]|uniref:L,D-transpeptidase n=1 Tax=Pseudonocardia lacus TaxID=2835865 RepID=UPI001BDC5DFF|nr:Ig-like domain-containing protein [Pseudonocardia lacus]